MAHLMKCPSPLAISNGSMASGCVVHVGTGRYMPTGSCRILIPETICDGMGVGLLQPSKYRLGGSSRRI